MMLYCMASRRSVLLKCFEMSAFLIPIISTILPPIAAKYPEDPEFSEPLPNNTVAVGRDAILACSVENLGTYKVAWLRVDTQTILTLHNYVVTINQRISVSHNDLKVWFLHIKEVRESDRGWYMCEINTDPMKSQVCHLDVVVSPDILDFSTSSDIVVDEGSDVTLKCVARGSPEPSILWKREDGQLIPSAEGSGRLNVSGVSLNISKIRREHMGPYLCLASNGVPPSVSKRIIVVVQFPPSIWIQYQLVGAYDGQQITLECNCEAYPKSINYWTRDNGEIIPHSVKYLPEIIEHGYRVHMKLNLNLLGPEDYGIYKCISKNSLGEMEGTINVYKIPNPSLGYKLKGSLTERNDVVYQIGTTDKDRAHLLLQENKLNSCAQQQVSQIFTSPWLHLFFIAFRV